jgi:hypothetical protein
LFWYCPFRRKATDFLFGTPSVSAEQSSAAISVTRHVAHRHVQARSIDKQFTPVEHPQIRLAMPPGLAGRRPQWVTFAAIEPGHLVWQLFHSLPSPSETRMLV